MLQLWNKFYIEGFFLALKQNIEYVKESLNSQEQFLGNLIKGEKFFKKHKVTIITIIILFLAYISFTYINNHSKSHNLKVSNEAYQELMKNPDNKEAQELLEKTNLNLYSLFLYHNLDNEEALKKIMNEEKLNETLSDFYNFESSLKSKDGFMEDYVNLIQAFKALQSDKKEDAKAYLMKIPLSSELFTIANSYMHLLNGSEK